MKATKKKEKRKMDTSPATYAQWKRCKTAKQKLRFIEIQMAAFEAYMDDDEQYDSAPAFAFANISTWFTPWLLEQSHRLQGLMK